jgi:uncharacterized membrane protein YeaQ/YmgE (transglycosylase-associated protein family)
MSKLGRILAGLTIGSVVGALLISGLSANVHDKSLEGVMTAAFVTGPIGALIGSVVLLVLAPRATS